MKISVNSDVKNKMKFKSNFIFFKETEIIGRLLQLLGLCVRLFVDVLNYFFPQLLVVVQVERLYLDYHDQSEAFGGSPSGEAKLGLTSRRSVWW